MTSIKDQIIEVIMTHPEDTITIPDVLKEMEEGTNIETVRVCVSRDLQRLGYVKKTKKVGRFALYKIIKRGFQKAIPPKSENNGLSLEQIGMAMVRHIDQLKEKIKEIGAGYSHLQMEYNKEVEASKFAMKRKNDEINELNKQINILKERLKSKETKFPLQELIGRR